MAHSIQKLQPAVKTSKHAGMERPQSAHDQQVFKVADALATIATCQDALAIWRRPIQSPRVPQSETKISTCSMHYNRSNRYCKRMLPFTAHW